jgi:transposase InsO family protein
MEEMSKHGKKGLSAMRAGLSRNTAAKYRELGRLPSELRISRTWRTRCDPFEEDWPEIVSMLADAPDLEAKTIFEDLVERRPGRYLEGQLRTLQRRIRTWRALEGPEKEAYLAQEHRPGEAMQTDFTWTTVLGVTIAEEPFPHMLCHVVLPYSNWEWATVCRSESLSAIRRGVQAAVFRLGRVPRFHQTDNSTAATHDVPSGGRDFNRQYRELIEHLGMTPRTIAVGAKEQNGDVEASNGALKRRLEQHLLLRKSRDFNDVDAYENWLWGVLEKANRLRSGRVAEELAQMRPLVVERLPEYTEADAQVTTWTTNNIDRNVYSVPSRLIGEVVRVRKYEDRLEVYCKGVHQLSMGRLSGRSGHRIDYRHVIGALVRKPGGFARYKYRDDLFPTATFRAAYDALCEAPHKGIGADVDYVRILHLAATTMESEVEAALELLLTSGDVPTPEQVKSLVAPRPPSEPIQMPELAVDLTGYDALLQTWEAA